MTEAHAAVGLDRLPWLSDEPKPRARESARKAPRPRRTRSEVNPRELAGWGVAAALLLAGGSYWLGTQSAEPPDTGAYQAPAPVEPEATVRLPEARPLPAQPQVPIVETPEVRPSPAPAVSLPRATAEKSARRSRPAATVRRRKLSPMDMERSELGKAVAEQEGTGARQAEKAAPATVAPPPAVRRSQPLRLWPSRQVSGAYGRLVRIGAFGSRHQAKLGWRRMVRAYPAVGRLPAVVVETRNSRGRPFYRFQIGTTSQAHSEVLCQWMQRIRFSCAVVGLPWKPRGVER